MSTQPTTSDIDASTIDIPDIAQREDVCAYLDRNSVLLQFEDMAELYSENTDLLELDEDRQTVVLDLDILRGLGENHWKQATKNPDGFLSLARDVAASVYDLDYYPQPVFSGEVPENCETTLDSIRTSDVKKLRKIECRVTNFTEVYPFYRHMRYSCNKCMNSERIKQKWDGGFEEPESCTELVEDRNGNATECGSNSWERIDHRTSNMIDRQKLIVEDHHSNSDLDNPETMVAELNGPALTGRLAGGEDVELHVVVRTRKTGDKKSEIVLKVVGMETANKDFSAIDISEDEVNKIHSIANSDNTFSRLIPAIAPSTKGDYEDVRLACLLQLAGGVTETRNDSDIRGDIHVFLVGDPGTNKSTIGRFCSDTAPTGEFASAQSSSGVGLTASVVQEEQFNDASWSVKAGPIVKADGGLVVLDELDGSSKSDQESLNQVMSDGYVSVNKAGISRDLKSRFSMLAIANPAGDRFDLYGGEPLKDQIELYDSLYDRFDVILPLHDIPDENDRDKIEQILSMGESAEVESIEMDFLQKYIAYARTHYEPSEYADGVFDYLVDESVDLRQSGDAGTLAASLRDIAGLRRLAQASAKLRLDDVVQKEDVDRALGLVKRCIAKIYRDEAGNIDKDGIKSQVMSQEKRIEFFWTTYEGWDGKPTRSEMVSTVSEELSNTSKAQVQKDIDKLVGQGDIYPEGGDGNGPLRDTR